MATNLIETVISLSSNPSRFLPGVFEYFFAWLVTRRLVALVQMLPLLLGGISMFVLGLGGDWIDEVGLAKSYFLRAEEESTEVIANLETEQAHLKTVQELFSDQELSSDAQLFLRRTLQLTSSNDRAIFLVALQLANEGRLGQARELMRRAAPEETGGGYPPAHAWLAADQLETSDGEFADSTRLLADLKAASAWRSVSWNLMSVYARLLEREGKAAEAMRVLETSPSSEKLELQLAELASRRNQQSTLDYLSKRIVERVEQRIEAENAATEDLVKLATIRLYNREPIEARTIAQLGLSKEPNNTQLKRIKSEAYRIEYLLSIKSAAGQAQINLELLNSALLADPTNPAIAQEVARLLAGGLAVEGELLKELQSRLRDGEATALTHLLVAEGHLGKGEITKAIVHLVVANEEAPHSPPVLNNLALALARTDKRRLEQALKMSEEAVELTKGTDANMLDTQGEILTLLKRYPAAIAAYEAAIRIAPKNTEIRRKLSKIYEKLSMSDMARSQRAKIEELEKKE